MTDDPAVARTQSPVYQADPAAPVIVAGVDGSPTSWDAFSWAAGEALRSNGRLIVVYVMPFTEPAAALAVPYDYAGLENTRQAIAGELEDEAKRLVHDLGISVSFVSAYGNATETLADVARSVNAKLVVVGRSAKRWHQVAGSLSHRLICRKDAPVVVVVP
ncbi:universal stress protein [Kribbella sp. NBC_01484]|uniref:universal stress protein n=1 Tax=Kribbella sp. NBC_01484 TaxID=2903579 RepID=UPI002E343469|nr:universal stress protein [Kribbella sp. NBC_01484]